MKSNFESRYAVSPQETKRMTTDELRQNYLIERVFEADKINLCLTHYDRYITGGAMPVLEKIELPNPGDLKANYFLERREMGIINVGGKGTIEADEEIYELDFKEALYIGKETKKVTRNEAEVVTVGSLENSNHRTINKLLVASVIQTCQLQMGMTELKPGSVWNTMPAHTHDRRMEVYFYFEVPEGQSICHFIGEPQESRHIWMQNEQAVISPPWSIHAGAGTSNYTFIWGMAGENLDYGDMDVCAINELK